MNMVYCVAYTKKYSNDGTLKETLRYINNEIVNIIISIIAKIDMIMLIRDKNTLYSNTIYFF
jgi:hypothetical protein